MIYSFQGMTPHIDPTVFCAPNATIIGDVEIGERSSVWFNAVLRGDVGPIRIGVGTNIQDGCVMHQDWDGNTTIGDYVTVGHRAVIHGCSIGNSVLIGMGAEVMEGAKIGEGSIVAGGAVVIPGAEIPARSLVMGVPAKVRRSVSEDEVVKSINWAKRYAENAAEYLEDKGFVGQ